VRERGARIRRFQKESARMRLSSLLAATLLVLGAAGCASTPGGTPLYRREIGQAAGPDAKRLAEQVIERHGYQVDTYEETPEIRILTHWRHRLPFEDEQAGGITAAETRILVVARPRSHTELGTYYNIFFTMENRVGKAGDPAWDSTLDTPMFRAYADGIADDLRQLVANIGVRTYR
jgi:hypothetical protein